MLPNEDKKFHESVDETNSCNFPHPFRMILCGPPNTVNTKTVYNTEPWTMNTKPCIERIIIFHKDPTSKKYQKIYCVDVEELANIDNIDENVKF